MDCQRSKRLGSGNSEGSSERAGRSLDVHQSEEMGPGGSEASETLGVGRSEEIEGQSGIGSREGEGRGQSEWNDLNAVLLEVVYSYLPQEDRLEALLVSREWEKVVREGYALWRKVFVGRIWDLAGTKRRQDLRNARMLKVFKATEELTFSTHFENDKTHIPWLGSQLGSNLRSIELLSMRHVLVVVPALLAVCPELVSLVIQDSWSKRVRGSIRVSHSKLERLRVIDESPFYLHNCRSLIVDCPCLTHASTETYRDATWHSFRHRNAVPPTLTLICPLLKNVRLSVDHCVDGVLEMIAGQAPNIKVLEVSYASYTTVETLLLLNSLEVLVFKLQNVLPDDEIVVAVDLGCPFQGLRELTIEESCGFLSPALTCPSLEVLSVLVHQKIVQSVEVFMRTVLNVNIVCPKLKKVVMHAYTSRKPKIRLDLFHETLKKIEMRGLPFAPLHILCRNLEKLVITKSEHDGPKEAPPALDCGKLRKLHIRGFSCLLHLPPEVLGVADLQAIQDIKKSRVTQS